MGIKITIRDVDHGWKDRVKRVREGRKRATLRVGLLSAKPHGGSDQGLSVVDIGTIHEFGLGNNPERSFLRAWFDQNRPENIARLRTLAVAAYQRGEDREAVLNRFGLVAVSEIQQRISRGIAPPLHPATIARKGSSKPLIDTGQVRASITHEVVT